MRIRSITYFVHPRWPINELILQKAGIFSRHARDTFEKAGFAVQSVRLATPPFHEFLSPEDNLGAVMKISVLAHSEGFDYVSFGPAVPDNIESYGTIPEMLSNSSMLFLSGHLTTPMGAISLSAVRACAEVIHRAASIEKNGFANLRFAALANVGPWSPFFPAAYHKGKKPAFALAIEGADLAVEAF